MTRSPFKSTAIQTERVCDWLVNRIEAIIKATRVIVCTCENMNIAHPVRFHPIPPDSTRIEYYIFNERRWPAMPLGEFQIQIKRPMRKLYESRSKADRTMIEENLSEKLTFVQCYFSNNSRNNQFSILFF